MKGQTYLVISIVIMTVLLTGCQKASVKSSIQALNSDQKNYIKWTNDTFGSVTDSKYSRLSKRARKEMEKVWLAQIEEGPCSKHYACGYYEAINSLGAINSRKAITPLSEIAFDRREKDNRDRWMATRALGEIGDERVVPELIHLLYHYNKNTRLWAEISLVKITGQNFEDDWKAWGQWWNTQGKNPEFSPERIQWTTRKHLAYPGKKK